MPVYKDSEKIKQLSDFMRQLNKTDQKKAFVEKHRDLLDAISPIDLFYVEMYREKSAVGLEEIKATANKFVNVFYKGLKKHEMTRHKHAFIQNLIDENKAIIDHFDTMKSYFKGDSIAHHKAALKKGFEACLHLEKKFIKKENILFPKLESVVPSNRPLEVMWSLHDDARMQLKEILSLLSETPLNIDKLKPLLGTYYYLIYGIIQKEQLILLPVADQFLHDEAYDTMLEECFSYGYTFIEKSPPATQQSFQSYFKDNAFETRTGKLNFSQLDALLNTLPLDITFVDKNDTVRYFNDSKTRHFPRNPSVIGRLVQHCHPPKSVDTVKQIVEAFKSGEKHFAEFWITFKGVMLYITYHAVYNASNDYEGILEVSQDITRIKQLQGEQRLLNWK